MNTNAIIHEQIDWDGTIKSFQLSADQSIGELWIAFPDDYSDERNSPFYFLDSEYETIFRNKWANCQQRKLSSRHFYGKGDSYVFETTWQGIPTERDYLTYYALYLPEYGIPTDIRVTDTLDTGRQFSKIVFRDREKNRYIVYIECKSKFGQFNFNLFCQFHLDENNFQNSTYSDAKTVGFYAQLDHWKWMFSKDETEKVEQFFVTNNHYHMGDQYIVDQAGAVGPNATASGITFNQLNNSLPTNTNFDQLANELNDLRLLLLTKASNADHYKAIGYVAKAEEGAKEKNGNKVAKSLLSAGKWVLDAAKEIATEVLGEVIKKQIGG
jgi:hypothetical protein